MFVRPPGRDFPGTRQQNLGLQGLGDLWMWLQLMWLQCEVVRGPVGIVWGRFGTGLGPFGPLTEPKSTLNDTDRTSDNQK